MSMPTTDIETMISEGFGLVEASKLSLDDEFMKYEPKSECETHWQYLFKQKLKGVIENGINDFLCPKYRPSFNEELNGISYVKEKDPLAHKTGKDPIYNKSYKWWEKAASELCPERHSRIGKKHEHDAFMGFLIKKLFESGWEVEKAWTAICDGKYWKIKYGAEQEFDRAINGEILGFYDIFDIDSKTLAGDKPFLWSCVSPYGQFSRILPLGVLVPTHYYGCSIGESTCWVVMDA